MTVQKIGQLLDSLGVVAELEDDDLVSDAVVLLRTTPAEGPGGVTIAASDGLNWVDQIGLIRSSQVIVEAAETARYYNRFNDEDDDD